MAGSCFGVECGLIGCSWVMDVTVWADKLLQVRPLASTGGEGLTHTHSEETGQHGSHHSSRDLMDD